MARAQFQKGQKVWVECVGAWAQIEKVQPVWAKGFEEPVKVTYDVGLGREFQANELRLPAEDEAGYVDGMIERETQTTTYLGQGVAIPHGTNDARRFISKASLGFLQFPEGVDWDGETVHVVLPIASNSDEHVSILSALATTLADRGNAERLRGATDVDEVLALLTPQEEEVSAQ